MSVPVQGTNKSHALALELAYSNCVGSYHALANECEYANLYTFLHCYGMDTSIHVSMCYSQCSWGRKFEVSPIKLRYGPTCRSFL